MPHEMEFIFRTEDLLKLIDSKREFIVIKSRLEAAVLQDGKKAGVLKVKAAAVNRGKALSASRTATMTTTTEEEGEEDPIEVEGCPKPPCNTN